MSGCAAKYASSFSRRRRACAAVTQCRWRESRTTRTISSPCTSDSEKPTGSVCGGIGGFLCSTKFGADFRGVGAHAGGKPKREKNALLAAAAAAVNMHAISPHSGGATRVNVGVLNAGESYRRLAAVIMKAHRAPPA